jgi:hypothetical protein
MNLSDDRIKELRKRASNYGSLPESTINDILDDYSSLRAENERLWTENKALSSAVRYGWKARAEKAEAELEKMTKAIESWKKDEVIWKETEAKLLAQLAKQAPLVNALLRIANEAFPLEVTEKCMRSVARAALALREGAKK